MNKRVLLYMLDLVGERLAEFAFDSSEEGTKARYKLTYHTGLDVSEFSDRVNTLRRTLTQPREPRDGVLTIAVMPDSIWHPDGDKA